MVKGYILKRTSPDELDTHASQILYVPISEGVGAGIKVKLRLGHVSDLSGALVVFEENPELEKIIGGDESDESRMYKVISELDPVPQAVIDLIEASRDYTRKERPAMDVLRGPLDL